MGSNALRVTGKEEEDGNRDDFSGGIVGGIPLFFYDTDADSQTDDPEDGAVPE